MSASATEIKAGGRRRKEIAKGKLRLLNGKTVDERKAVCRRVQPQIRSGHEEADVRELEADFTPWAYVQHVDPERLKGTLSAHAAPNYGNWGLGAATFEGIDVQSNMSVLFDLVFDQEWVAPGGGSFPWLSDCVVVD
jgi:hypothetical protein